LISCRQTTSGWSRCSSAHSRSMRMRTEFTFHVTICIAAPYRRAAGAQRLPGEAGQARVARTPKGGGRGSRAAMHRAKGRFGWTEAIVFFVLLVRLAGTVVPFLADRKAAQRDAQRLADLRTIERAIEDYALDRRELPPHEPDVDGGGWDSSLDA